MKYAADCFRPESAVQISIAGCQAKKLAAAATGWFRSGAVIDGSGKRWCCVEPIVNIGCSIESTRFRSRVL
jgi:hypothetical protein